MSITYVIFERMRSNEYCVIAYDHLKLYLVIVFHDQPYFACVRLGSNLLRVYLDRNFAVRKYLRLHWSKIKDIHYSATMISAHRSL